VVDPSNLESHVRDVLNLTARRSMAVLEPLELRITNLPPDAPQFFDVPDFPAELDRGTHRVQFDPVIYIERSDFKERADKSYRRFTCDQTVGLKYAGYVLTVEKIHRKKDGNDDQIEYIEVKCQPVSETNKPKAFVHWVAKPVPCEVRLYERLFMHKNPEDNAHGGFLNDCNPNSLAIAHDAVVDRWMSGVSQLEAFQFERIGFFCVDADSHAPDKLVFNRTVLLREDSAKPA